MPSQHTLSVPFFNGTAYADSGWDVDAAGEYATAFFVLPSWISQVYKIRVYARSIVTETHAMLATITANGGGSNEAYTTEAISVADKVSETTNFAADDIIYWEIDSADDADIPHLSGGDAVTLKVSGVNAAGDNCATDAHFIALEILVV